VKCVHQTSSRTLAHLLRGALEGEGVSAVVQGEHLTPLQGQIPVGASAEYRVCIVDDEQLPKAQRFTAQWLEDPARAAGSPWLCAGCGEHNEPQFRSCWRCGSESDAA
jgi:hypothetical protein